MNDFGLAPLAITIRRDLAGIEALVPSWSDLWRRLPHATPFQSPAWLIAWWRHFAQGEPLVIAIHNGDRLAGLAPFYVADRVLRPIGVAVSDYLDVLIDAAIPGAEAALCATLRASGGEWDRAYLDDLPPDATLLRLPTPAGLVDETEVADPCPLLRFPAGNFRAMVPRLMRRNLGVAWRNAQRLGPLTIRTDLGVFDELVALHGARWHGSGQAGMLADPEVCAFHRTALPQLAEAGALRLYGIAVGDRVIAAYYGFLHRGRAYAYLIGFDPTIPDQSLGTVALGPGLAAAAAEGAEEWHLLRGGESYKYGWGAVDRFNRRRRWSRA